MFLTKVAAQRLKLEGADIDNAYLCRQLDKPIIMKPPSDSFGKVRYPGYVCLVVKYLYGARQAGKIWGTDLHKNLLKWNFVQSTQDQRLYYLVRRTSFLMLIIGFDDISFTSSDHNLMQDFELKLSSTFKVKLLGTLTSFIAWQLHHSLEKIYVNQAKFVEKLLTTHNLSHCKAPSTPFPLTIDVSSRHSGELVLTSFDHHRFCSLVGSLVYLAV